MQSDFHVDVRVQDQTAVIALAGELDLATSPQLEGELGQVIESGARRVVIDLRELSFMDSTGLSVLIKAQNNVAEHEGELYLVKGPPQVQRLLSLTGVDTRVALVDSPDEVLR